MSEIGGPKPGLMNIGEEAEPPFAVLPDPASLLLTRAKQFATPAHGHELCPCLGFLGRLTDAGLAPRRPQPVAAGLLTMGGSA